MPPQKRYISNSPNIEKKGVAASCKAPLLERYTRVFCALYSLTPGEKIEGLLWEMQKEMARWLFEEQRFHA